MYHKMSLLWLMGLEDGVYKELIQPSIQENYVNCKIIRISELNTKSEQQVSSQQYLEHAAINNKEIGSSTLVVHSLDQTNGIVNTSLIGDSGYIIFRR